MLRKIRCNKLKISCTSFLNLMKKRRKSGSSISKKNLNRFTFKLNNSCQRLRKKKLRISSSNLRLKENTKNLKENSRIQSKFYTKEIKKLKRYISCSKILSNLTISIKTYYLLKRLQLIEKLLNPLQLRSIT